MKHLFFSALLGMILFGANLFTQAQTVTHNGIAVNASGQLLTNQFISLRLSVLDGSASGTAVYVETQSVTTSATGTYTVQIGQGSVVSGTFASINWMANNHFLKVAMDPVGGTNYAITSISQLLVSAHATSSTITWQCGSTLTVNHLAGQVAPVSKSVTYSTVNNIPGETTKCWITSNLGADHQATAVSDATEASAGWYWQFNRKQGYKHDGTTLTPAWTNTWINENSDWLTANDPCTSELGTGWRLPTRTEWTNLNASGNWTSWSGPWNSGLKLHAAGYLDNGDGSLNFRGFLGHYWSSSQGGSGDGGGLYFYNSGSGMDSYYKALGLSVRCLRD